MGIRSWGGRFLTSPSASEPPPDPCTTLACGEQLIHVPQTQGKAEVEPDGVADDLGREAIAGLARANWRCHPARLLASSGWRKPTSRQVDDALALARPRFQPHHPPDHASRPHVRHQPGLSAQDGQARCPRFLTLPCAASPSTSSRQTGPTRSARTATALVSQASRSCSECSLLHNVEQPWSQNPVACHLAEIKLKP